MPKWLRWLLPSVAALLLVLFATLYFGGRWAVKKYLGHGEIALGTGRLKVVHPEFFGWGLKLQGDSVIYLSPVLNARAGSVSVAAELFQSLLHFSPSVGIRIDTLDLALLPAPPDSTKPKSEPKFPDFQLPLAINLRTGLIRVADSSGPIASLAGIEVSSHGRQGVTLEIRKVGARAAGNLTAALDASLDWSDKDQVSAKLALTHGRDSATINLHGDKAKLTRGGAEVRAHVASSSPYAKVFNLPDGLPLVEDAVFTGRAGMDSALIVHGNLKAGLSGFSKTTAYRLSRQKIACNVDFNRRAGTWSLSSHGADGEQAELSGGIFLTAADSLANAAFVAGHLGVTAKGRIRNVTVIVSGDPKTDTGARSGAAKPGKTARAEKTVKADVDLTAARVSSHELTADVATDDGSKVKINLMKIASENALGRVTAPASSRSSSFPRSSPESPGRGWRGDFSATLVPGERWVTAFVDTNVSFRSLSITGRAEDGVFSARMDAAGLRAYGVLADSARLFHRYAPARMREAQGNTKVTGHGSRPVVSDFGGYALLPSHWYYRGVDWSLSGKAAVNSPGRPLEVHLENPECGSAELAMPRPTFIEAHVKNLTVEKLPFRGLDSLAKNHPRVTADFTWDKKTSTGNVSLQASGNYRGEDLGAQAKASWTSAELIVEEVKAEMGASVLRASARARLHGKAFYEAGKLTFPDFESLSLGADHFDLAKALAAALPHPPLDSGRVSGDFAYAEGRGFSGAYHFRGLHLAAGADLYGIKEVDVLGLGDSLGIRGVTVSSKEPWLNDSLIASLGGALRERQTLSAHISAAKSLSVDFRGGMRGFRDVEGRLAVAGGGPLPGKSGELRNVLIKASMAMDFKLGIRSLKVDADTLGGDYLIAGLDTQTLSAPLHVKDGKLSIPALRLRGKATNKGGGSQAAVDTGVAELNGRLDYAFGGNRVLRASLAGSRLSAQLGPGDRLQLRELRVDLRADSANLELQAAIGGGSAEHVKAPLRAAGDFSKVAIFYRAPLGRAQAATTHASGSNANAAAANGRTVDFGGPIPYLRVQATIDTSNVRYRIRSMETLQNLFKHAPQRRQAAHRDRPMQVQINLETSGKGNSIDTDILRLSYVGNISIYGTYPYELVQGRFSSYQGQLGIKRQAFDIHRMEVKWLNEPLEDGAVYLDAEKRLAKTCETNMTDSCMVISKLTGRLGNLQYSYDSDCQGAYGTGANVAALVYSMRRGCYSGAFSTGTGGVTPQEQALGLLEPLASNYLTMAAEKYSGNLIASTQVTGLGALAANRKAAGDTAVGSPMNSATANDAVALEVLSKEFWRMRVRAKYGYRPDYAEQVNPWVYRVGLEWKPPIFRLIDDPNWKQRVKNNVSMEAAVFTDPDHVQDPTQDPMRQRVGLNYNYDFWGYWWSKEKPRKDSTSRGSKP